MKKLIKQIILMLLGQNIGNKLIYFACYFIPKLKSYSQFGEDLIINNFFDHFNIKNGNFLDIGAYHPKFISNTYLLRKKGWKGVYVEANPIKSKLFEFFNSGFKIINKGVIENKNIKNKNFYMFKKLYSEIDTFDKDIAMTKSKNLNIDYEIKGVETTTLEELLEEFPYTDFLNIDIEGLDEKCLLGCKLNKYSLKLIVFENTKNWGGSKEIKIHMNSMDFFICLQVKILLVFLEKYNDLLNFNT